MQKDESERRYDLISKTKAREHIAKIKKFRKGHKLIITRDIIYRNKVEIPAGTTVKLLKAKGQKKRAEVYYEKTDEEWLIDFKYLEDAQDPETKKRTEQNIETQQAFQELFRR